MILVWRALYSSSAINVQGIVIFESGSIKYSASYNPLAGAMISTLKGDDNTIFKAAFTANASMLIMGFKYSGIAIDLIRLKNTLFIPWLNLLTSPVSPIFFNLLLFAIFLIHKRLSGIKK